jgi:phosphoribosylformylglycinamidine cyclo-ligase
MQEKMHYKNAGVDIDKANLFIEKIKPLIKMTFRKEVTNNIGGFGSLFHLDLGKIKDPILVSSTDGVGTKLKIAQMLDKHDTIGIDLVAMSVNDVIVQGAEPLFFLDYFATGKIDVEKSKQIIEGIIKGCVGAGCALIGGETAEMPGIYKEDEYDLAGFCVGIVDSDKLIDGSEIRVGNKIIGIASSGLHSNGYSLARKVLLGDGQLDIHDWLDELGCDIGSELLRPTKIYVKPILNLLKSFAVKGIVHITGGGFIDNLPRIIPTPCQATITKNSWEVPPVMAMIQRKGKIDEAEMYRVFNMGIGMMIVVSEKDVSGILERLKHLEEQAYLIGHIEKRDANQDPVRFV